MSFEDFEIEHHRLRILQLLEEDVDYSKNEHIIQGGLHAYGYGISAARLRTELHWLQEQGLVTIEEIGGVLVVKLTMRGEDVALGRARVPGVARPRPGG